MKDLERERRRYLLHKADRAVNAAAGITMMVVAGVVMAAIGFIAVYSRALELSTLVYFAIFGPMFFGGAWLFWRSVREIRALPYVPPVREQVECLPDESVLVRGASGPLELLTPISAKEGTGERTENRRTS